MLGGLGTYVDAVAHRQAVTNEVMVCVLVGEAKQYNTVPRPADNHRLTVVWKRFHQAQFVPNTATQRLAAEVIEEFGLGDLVAFQPEVIHVHDWYGALWGAALQQKLGIPLIFTSHLPTRAGFVYSGHTLPLQHKTQFEALAVRVADRVIVPSQFLADTLIAEYNCQQSKIVVIPNGISEAFFADESSQASADQRSSIEILSVSRLVEQKGLLYLVRALSELDLQKTLVHCTIVGDGPLKKNLRNEIKKRRLQDTITLVGFKDHQALRKLYKKADIFVSTSIYEPFGLVVLEAMAAGLAVVAFKTGGIPEILTNNNHGRLVQPCDVVALASVITQLTDHPLQRRTLGKAAQNRAREFLWPIIIKELSIAYQKALDKSIHAR